MIVHVENKEQFVAYTKNERVLVDFYADWCGPCQMLSPIIEELAKEEENLLILKVNVDEVSALAKEYGISSIPSLIYFEKGEIKNRRIGYLPLRDLKALVS